MSGHVEGLPIEPIAMMEELISGMVEAGVPVKSAINIFKAQEYITKASYNKAGDWKMDLSRARYLLYRAMTGEWEGDPISDSSECVSVKEEVPVQLTPSNNTCGNCGRDHRTDTRCSNHVSNAGTDASMLKIWCGHWVPEHLRGGPYGSTRSIPSP